MTERVVVGCSGGADSLALLAISCDSGFEVVAVYVDHGLRANTAHEASVVAAAAARFGASFRCETVRVEPGPNLEARARDARYDALERVRADVRADAILVGHTRDDQAETVLLNLLRGSGTAGLAGMAPERGYIRRPLLETARAETRELCARLGLAPVHDPMNDDIRHRRVWLRREVIPFLERGADRDLTAVLARQAGVMRDDEQLLDALIAPHLTDDVRAIAAMPDALARRVVRRWLGSPPPSLATVERVLSVARGERLAAEIPGGDRVSRRDGRLTRRPPSEHHASGGVRTQVAQVTHVRMAVPGTARIGGYALEAWVEHGPPAAWPDGRWAVVADADIVPDSLEVTITADTPVCSAGGPVWVVGYRIDHRVRVTSRTQRFLWLTAEPDHQ